MADGILLVFYDFSRIILCVLFLTVFFSTFGYPAIKPVVSANLALFATTKPTVFPHRIDVMMRTALFWFHFIVWPFKENIRSDTRHLRHDDCTSIYRVYSLKKPRCRFTPCGLQRKFNKVKICWCISVSGSVMTTPCFPVV